MGDSRVLDNADRLAGFHVMLNGQVEAGEFQGMDNLYFKYSFNFGADWKILQGVDTGLSQISRKASGADTSLVWNFPIDITFKSTNAYGWPRFILSVSWPFIYMRFNLNLILMGFVGVWCRCFWP